MKLYIRKNGHFRGCLFVGQEVVKTSYQGRNKAMIRGFMIASGVAGHMVLGEHGLTRVGPLKAIWAALRHGLRVRSEA
jgi:hypothetical protein